MSRLLLLLALILPASANNLLRNGSFEGATLYWHDAKSLVEAGKDSQHAMHIEEGWSLSAPFVAEKNQSYTISLWAKASKDNGTISIGMSPMAREVANKAKRIWNKEATQDFNVTNDWKRVSATFKADVPQNGFWPKPHYGVFLGGKNVLVDGVTLTKGTDPTPDFLPRKPLEAVADCLNLPGFEGSKGNIFEQGASAKMAGSVFNPTTQPISVTARWQLIDYEGVIPLANALDQKITVKPGATTKVSATLPLTTKGTVIARFSVVSSGGETIDSSDFPLTTLAFPKNSTQPDYRERFGGSFAGGIGCLEKMQRIGFGWSRWWPTGKWHAFQPEEGRYDWQDDKFEEAFKRGISCHVVLYGWPEWIMDKEHPLPRDMRWKSDDPRWDDLKSLTAWDKFIIAAAEHFKGKPVVLQLANEPGHDRWKDGYEKEYVKFMLRSARLLKQTDPNCKVSLNNVYANPSKVNGYLLNSEQLKDIDIWSWHDYRAGVLMDQSGIKRMRTMLDNKGGDHLELWFTEGWAFTNTLVDQPPACTGMTSIESTHATTRSAAEMSAAGHDKIVMFHLLYETHGQSFWDYSGPGTMLWDWYGNPLPTLSSWNVLNHHIGLSEEVGVISPPGGVLCLFQNLRTDEATIIAYADRNAPEDTVIERPFTGFTATDIMGNPTVLKDNKLALSKTGRPVVLTTSKQTAKELFKILEPLDRKHLGVASTDGTSKTYRLPDVWEGTTPESSDGNPAMLGEQPVWRLERLYPKEKILPANYTPMVWGNQKWEAPDHTHGGHPSATVKDGSIRFGTMGPWSGELNFRKQGALTFIAPEDGQYQLKLTARSKPWEGKNTAHLYILKRDEQRAGEIKKIDLPPDNSPVPLELTIDLAKGHELVFLVEMPHHNNSTNISIEKITVTKLP